MRIKMERGKISKRTSIYGFIKKTKQQQQQKKLEKPNKRKKKRKVHI